MTDRGYVSGYECLKNFLSSNKATNSFVPLVRSKQQIPLKVSSNHSSDMALSLWSIGCSNWRSLLQIFESLEISYQYT